MFDPPENPELAALLDLFPNTTEQAGQLRSRDEYEHAAIDPVVDALAEVAYGLSELSHRLRLLAKELRGMRPR